MKISYEKITEVELSKSELEEAVAAYIYAKLPVGRTVPYRKIISGIFDFHDTCGIKAVVTWDTED